MIPRTPAEIATGGGNANKPTPVKATFMTDEGREFLSILRTFAEFDVPAKNEAPVRMLAQLPSEDCGCPEELWFIDGMLYLIHMEEDGTSEIFLFAGDEEHERLCACNTIESLRVAMFQWHAEIMEQSE